MEILEKRIKEIEALFKEVGSLNVDEDIKREYFCLISSLYEMKNI